MLDPVWKSLGHLLTLSLQPSVAILRSSLFHGWGNRLSCSLGLPILSDGKYSFPLLKLSLAHFMLLVRNRSHSPMSTQKFRHHPILCSTGCSLKMGLPNSSAVPKTGPPTAYHNHLGSFWNKTQEAWTSHSRCSGLAWCSGIFIFRKLSRCLWHTPGLGALSYSTSSLPGILWVTKEMYQMNGWLNE